MFQYRVIFMRQENHFAPINFWLGGPSAYYVFHPRALPFRVYSTTTERQEL